MTVNKILFNILVVSFFINNDLSAQEKTTLAVATHASQENIQWSISGNLNGSNPNILSEVAWKQLVACGYAAKLNLPLRKRLAFFLNFSQQFIAKGSVTDADYLKDNKTDAVFFAKEDAGKGMFTAITPGALFLIIDSDLTKFYCGGGYGVLNQHLYLINEQKGLNSKYTNYWYGPLMVAKVQFRISDIAYIDLRSSYHQIAYRAVADWNLIEEFEHPKSFTHKAKGLGVENQLAVRYQLNENLELIASLQYNYWSTGKGIDELYKKDQSGVKTRLNEVKRSNSEVGAGLVFRLF